jgi:hypothetical protein
MCMLVLVVLMLNFMIHDIHWLLYTTVQEGEVVKIEHLISPDNILSDNVRTFLKS